SGNLRFAFYLLNSLELDRNTRDTGVPGLERNEAHNRRVWLPDLPTQKAIADFLDRETDRIDSLIEKKKSLISLLSEREEGFARSLLSGASAEAEARISTSTPWLSSVPSHWEIVPLRYLVRISTGGRDTQDRTDDGVYPFFVRSMNIER